MSAKETIHTLLSGTAAITAIVGNRIWPASIPSGRNVEVVDAKGTILKPFITYTVSTEKIKHLSGTYALISMAEIDVYHNKAKEVSTLTGLVDSVLDDYEGGDVLGIFQQEQADTPEEDPDLTPFHEKLRYKIILDG